MQIGKQPAFTHIKIGASCPIKGCKAYFLYKRNIKEEVVKPKTHLKRMRCSIRLRENYLAIRFGAGYMLNRKFYIQGLLQANIAVDLLKMSMNRRISE
jgi:hypothetical protein